jgi:hypothetical protein
MNSRNEIRQNERTVDTGAADDAQLLDIRPHRCPHAGTAG